MIERDLLRMFDYRNMWENTTIWQILVMCITFLLQLSGVVFGTPLVYDESYMDRCMTEMENNNAKKFMRVKGTQTIDLWYCVLFFLIMHLYELMAYQYIKKDEFVRISEAWPFNKQDDTEENRNKRYAKASRRYLEIWFWRVLITTPVFACFIQYNVCQPFLGTTLYQDYIITLMMPIWVLCEAKILRSGHKTLIKMILDNHYTNAKKHFWRTRYILVNGEQPDEGYKLGDESENPLKVD
jgi:hypothetical protein